MVECKSNTVRMVTLTWLFFLVVQFSASIRAEKNSNTIPRIRGYIQDAGSNHPIAAVSIRIHNTSIVSFSELDGRFSIDTLPRNKFTVIIEGSGYVPIELRFPALNSDTCIVIDTALIAIKNEQSINGKLTKHKALMFGIVRNQRSGDTITDVKIQLPDEGPIVWTDKNGFFSLLGPDSGLFKLIFSHDDYYPEVITYNSFPGTLQQVEVLLIPVLSLEEETGYLSGVVTDKKNHSPIHNAELSIENTQYTVVTDSLGGYEFKFIPPGMYAVKVKAEGYPFRIVAPIVFKKGSNNKLEVSVSQESEGADSNSSGRSAIFGIVKSGDGKPLKNVVVKISKNSKEGLTDGSGYFSFNGLESGEYSLYAVNNVLDTAYSDNILLARDRTEYTTIVFGNPVQVLSDSVAPENDKALVYGNLTDEETGSALSGVAIAVGKTKINAVSGQNGRYLADVTRSGLYTLRFSKSGFIDTTISVNVTRGEVSLSNVSLKKTDVQELSKLTVHV